MRVILLSNDLMSFSQITSAARAAGVELVMVASEPELLERAAEGPFDLALFDLATEGYDIVSAVTGLKQLPTPPAQIIAYGPHVQEAALQQAGEAGCDKVMARGPFLKAMPRLFAGS